MNGPGMGDEDWMRQQDRRTFIKSLGAGAAAAAFSGLIPLSCNKREGKKPKNVIFLFSDDQRFDMIGCLYDNKIKTPNVDSLVSRGLTFTRAHIMGGTSGAVCMPSRAMLLCGRTLFHLENKGASIPRDNIMLPEFLRQKGYKTFGTGKWHNGKNAYARCFNDGGKIFFGGMSSHTEVPVYDFDPIGEYPQEKQYQERIFSSELFSNEAIRFLNDYTSDEPFFLYISYTAPHDPRMAPDEYTNMYDPEKIPLPENFLPEHPFDNGEMNIRDENLALRPRSPEIIREHIAAYYAMISHLDYHVGRVLDALERTGQADNTIIVFTGDNGLAVGQHGLLGKQNLYDHSVRVPLIFSGPGIPRGKVTDALCYLSDIYPTLCDLLDYSAPLSVEGSSLRDIINGKKEKIRDRVFLAYRHFQRGVRTEDDWKLIKYNVRGKVTTQLFNLNDDPWEINNLADDSCCQQRLKELTAFLQADMESLNDFCSLDKPNWGVPEQKYGLCSVNHLAVGNDIRILNNAKIEYTDKGSSVLIDGIRATSSIRDSYWAGVQGEDLEVEIDLGRIIPVKEVTVGCLEDQDAWIFFPLSIDISGSNNGTNFKLLVSRNMGDVRKSLYKRHMDYSLSLNEAEIRYLRVVINSIHRCPSWHAGSEGKAWIFVDEILVE